MLILVAVGLLVALGANSLYGTVKSRALYVETSRNGLTGTAALLAADASRSFLEVREMLDVGNPLQIGALTGVATEYQRRVESLPQVIASEWADSEGAPVLSDPGSRIPGSPQRFDTAAGQGRLQWVSPPFRNTATGQWLLPLVNSVRGAPSNTSLLVSYVDLTYLRRLYQAVESTTATTATLILRDGTVIATNNEDVNEIGKRVAPLAEILNTGRSSAAGSQDTLTEIATLPGFDIGIIVQQRLQEVLAPWRTELLRVTAPALAIMLATLVLVLVLATKLRQLDKAAETMTERAALLDLSSDAILLRDLHGTIRFWNKGAETLYGYRADEAVNQPVDALLKTRYPVDNNAVMASLRSENRWAGEVVRTTNDGREITVSSRWTAQRDARQAVIAILQADADLTEQRRMQLEMDALRSAKAHAERIDSLGTLAGGIAHDFNNVLGAVLGYGELSRDRAEPDSAVRVYGEQIVEAANRGKALVARLLAFVHGKQDVQTDVLLDRTVGQTLDLLQPSIPAGVTVQWKPGAPEMAVHANAAQLHQIVTNLCTNALHALGTTGVLKVVTGASVLTTTRPLFAGIISPGDYAWVEVSDSGCGMPDGVLARIFEPYFSTKEFGTGTGLGLAIIRRLVQELNGGIDVVTQVGKGTTFTVYLPVVAALAGLDASEEPWLPGSGETIMIVDDEPQLVMLAEEILAQLGYEPIGFTSPVKAWEAFQEEPQRFDALVTDETMPERTGSELAELVRSLNPALPIVIVSGNVEPHLDSLCQRLSHLQVLHKPLMRRELAVAMSKAIPQAVRHPVSPA